MLTHTPTAQRKPARGRHADRKQRRRLGQRARLLRHELLEDRRVLSAGSILGTDGFETLALPTEQPAASVLAGDVTIAPGPLVVKASPTERANISQLNLIRVWFAEPVDPNTFGVDDVKLTGPGGSITVDNVTVDADTNDTRFAIAFATQTEYGWYRLEMGPNVLDLDGHPMNQDQDANSGEPLEDQFVTSIYLGTPRISISDAETIEGDDGTTELLFTVTRERDPSVAFSVDYATINDSATAAGFAGTTSFSRRIVRDSFDIPTSVFAADLDEDGDQDLITSDWNTATVAWHENDGFGNFTMRVLDEHTAGASSVFAADVDGDGDNDVLAASYYYDEISWHENDGSGHFIQHIIPSPADGPVFVSAADVDGDGDIDVLSASHEDGRITWFENNGAESFTAHTITDTLSVPNQAIAADVDGDGDMDILTASQNDDTIAWFENDGAENFTKHVITDTADGARSVAGHDVDGDGDMDVLSGSAGDDTVAWYENDGHQNFARNLLTDDASGGSDVMIVVEDLDGDGDGDILAGVAAWFENDGDGNFTSHTIGSLYSTWGLATADIDGDSDLDVLSVSVSDMISWYENSLINPVPADYEATSGTLAFAAGETEKTISVTVFGDTDIEPDEALYVTISISSEEAQVADSQGIGTILNDDEPLVLFADSFEHGQWNGLWVEDSQNDWFTSTQRETDGNYSAEVDGRATNATLTLANPVDMTPYGGAELTFDWYIERGFDSGEYLALDFSPNGSTWTEIKRLRGNVDQENTWHNETIDIDPAYLTRNFKLRFRAYVSSSLEDANVDNVKIIATGLAAPPSDPPVAEAGGPYYADEGGSVLLAGSASADPDGVIVAWDWDLDNNGIYETSGMTTLMETPNDGVFTVGLRVTDDAGLTSVDTAVVTVANLPPTADISGPCSGNEGLPITLNASASTDPGSDSLSFAWDLDNDSHFDDATGVAPLFTPPDNGDYTISVQVTDSGGLSHAATTTVTAVNVVPVADIGGPYSVQRYSSIALDASASSDVPADPLSFAWDLDNDGQYDDGFGATIPFVGTAPGAYPVSVQVSDDDGGVSVDSATVIVTEVNVPPVADIGGPYVSSEGGSVTLNASGSHDPDGTIVLYEWDLDGDGQYDDAVGETSPLSTPSDGTLPIGLRVTDDDGDVDTAQAAVTVNNVAPTANAGGPYTTEEGVNVTLDGSASTDPGNDIADYDWDLDGDGQFDDASGDTIVFNQAIASVYGIGLRVTDTEGATDEIFTTVTVSPVATGPKLDKGLVLASTNAWTTVTLDNSYGSMVVVLTPNYDRTHAAHGRPDA
jgi:hypothetical protein